MEKIFRVIDTGQREGPRNMALSAALIELRKEGRIGDTLRFQQFPPTVLIGRHQALGQEVRLDFCRTHGVGLARRITGGGAIYMDPGQFGFELVFNRATLGLHSLSDLTRELCESLAEGLSTLGVAARFRPRNDIEVDGRKISGTGGFFDGDAVLFQGTVLVEMDPDAMLGALNVPREKLAKRDLDSAAQRVVTLRELLGSVPPLDQVKGAVAEGFARHLGLTAHWGKITPEEEALAARLYDEEIGTEAFLHSLDDPGLEPEARTGQSQGPGGTISAHVRLEGPRSHRIREVLITGDFFVTPPRVILDLEARLRGVAIDEVREHASQFFAEASIGLLTAQPEDFIRALEDAVQAPTRHQLMANAG